MATANHERFATRTEVRPEWTAAETTPFDFIVVGSGAGGAPLAARLVERGYHVLVVEMGTRAAGQGDDQKVDATRVPLLHGEVTEDPRHSLRFFVKHFEHDPDGSRDPKIHRPGPSSGGVRPQDEHGVFYPRAQGIGGCTVHNAMITICGPAEDWDEIAEATGDASWRGEKMRAYFERLEKCLYARPLTILGRLRQWLGGATGWEQGRHGDRGWLETQVADLHLVLDDKRLLRTVLGAAFASLDAGIERIGELLRVAFRGRALPHLDPNHFETMRHSLEGLVQIPCAITADGERSGPRERLLATGMRPGCRERLTILTGTCVTEVVLERSDEDASPGRGYRATGIRCLPRAHVYEADPQAAAPGGAWRDELVTLHCRREVLLCGGAFNTPQLLMLSGIGDEEHLASCGIETRVALPGVGRNLQDRYEVPVIATVSDRFRSLDGLRLTSRLPAAGEDPALATWVKNAGRPAAERGVYATNGALLGIIRRSSHEDLAPDLFLFALAANFPGYAVGWSKPDALAPGPSSSSAEDGAADHKRTLTWLVLKARTRGREGFVKLRDAHPFRRPEIDFRSFPAARDDEGAVDPSLLDADLEAIREGVDFVKQILECGKEDGLVEDFELPGREAFDSDGEWVKNVAWGHHACGTCRIGADDDAAAVLDGRFRVRGVSGLRVVDASVFPRIPGFFIVTNVYMAAEKAADVIAEDHPLAELPPDAAVALECEPILRSRRERAARLAYPVELEAQEAALIARRRRQAGR
jgi:choline dehydrogenase